ncbi:MAG: hypothetical protein HOE90_20020 [Bacteriovoracaceae bacterium]|jgi:hypothetical protein|nr:hypothetical protein [Bacteriovoracaceae bacterium]
MRNCVFLILFSILFTFSQNSFAEDKKGSQTFLCSIHSSNTTNYSKMHLKLDGKSDVKSFFRDVYKSEEKSGSPRYAKSVNYLIAKLKKGIVLKVQKETVVVSMSSDNFAAHNGGTITLKYLKSYLSKSYGSVTFTVDRLGDSWVAKDDDGNTFTKINMKAKKIFGKVIGIKKVTFN